MVTKMVKAVACDLCGSPEADHWRIVRLDPRQSVNVDLCEDCSEPLGPMLAAGRIDGRTKKRTVTPLSEVKSKATVQKRAAKKSAAKK